MKIDECHSSLRVELADADPSARKWSPDELTRVIKSAVSDLDRYLPWVRICEVTISPTITDEAFTSAHDVWVALKNGQIKPKSESIHNSTIYTRGTDYEMDYSNGKIMVLSTGAMLDATVYKADYSKSRIAVPLDSVDDLIRIRAVEFPMGRVPQSMVGYQVLAGTLFIATTSGGSVQSQTEMSAGEHLAITYDAINTPPTGSADGSYPRALDHVVIKGALAYAFFIQAAKLNNKAAVDMESARSQVVDITAVLTAVDTILNKVTGHVDEAGTALDKLGGFTSAATSALDQVAYQITAVADLLQKVPNWADVAGEAASALTKAGTADSKAATALAKVSGSVTAAESVLGEVKTASDEAKAALEGLPGYLSSLNTGIIAMLTLWDQEQKEYRDGALGNLVEGATYINKVTVGKDPDEMRRRYAEVGLLVVAAAGSKLEAIAGANLRLVDELNVKLTEAAQNVARAGALASAGAARVGAANAHAGEAAQYVGAMASWVGAAGQAAGVAQVWVGAANARVGAANAYIAEASQRINAAALYDAEAGRRLDMARTYIDEATARISKIQYMLLSAQQYAALATTGAEVAGKFREEGGARHAEYWRILNDRTQWMRERVSTSVLQPKA